VTTTARLHIECTCRRPCQRACVRRSSRGCPSGRAPCPEVVLTTRSARTCSPNHPAARVLPDPRGAGDPAATGRLRLPSTRRGHGDRTRLRLLGENRLLLDALTATARCVVTCGGLSAEPSPTPPTACSVTTPTSPCTGVVADFTEHLHRCRTPRPRLMVFLGGTSATSSRPNAPRSCAGCATACVR